MNGAVAMVGSSCARGLRRARPSDLIRSLDSAKRKIKPHKKRSEVAEHTSSRLREMSIETVTRLSERRTTPPSVLQEISEIAIGYIHGYLKGDARFTKGARFAKQDLPWRFSRTSLDLPLEFEGITDIPEEESVSRSRKYNAAHQILTHIASNESSSPDTLRGVVDEIESNPTHMMAAASYAAMNRSAPQDVLRRLYKVNDIYNDIKGKLVDNPSTPIDVIIDMMDPGIAGLRTTEINIRATRRALNTVTLHSGKEAVKAYEALLSISAEAAREYLIEMLREAERGSGRRRMEG